MQEPGTTLRVTAVRPLPPLYVRVEVEAVEPGAGLHDVGLPGTPDEACLLHLPLPDGTRDPDGRWYTLRRVSADGRRAVVDVVVHDGGVGAAWACRARVGDEIVVTRSRGWFERPAAAGWQILVGDAAALPALARAVEETPAGLRTDVVVELPEGTGSAPLPEGTPVRVCAAPPGQSRLEEIVRELELPDGPGYLYVGGEAAATRGARRYLRHERGLTPADYRTLGYWRRDADRFRERFRAAPEWFAGAWARAEAAGQDDEQVLDHYERTLSEAGVI